MFIRILAFLSISLVLFGSYTSEFYDCFEQKKAKEWHSLVEIGEKALQEQSDAKIHARLASLYFYLGKYEAMKTHIDACMIESLDAASEELVVRSLYLLSAYHRINQHYTSAQQVIQKALTKARALNQPCLLAKVLFNAGAAEADHPQGDIDLAQKYYEEALTYFSPDSDDAHRLLIRLGRIYFLKKEFYKLNPLLSNLSQANLAPRTRVHFYSLSAQVALANDAIEEGEKWIEKGLQLAKKMEMRKDYERLELLKEKHPLSKSFS